MSNPLSMKSWSPYAVGIAIGMLCWFSFATADRPLGITTAFEHSAAMTEKAVAPTAAENNDYFAEQAAEGKPPKIDWEWMLVLGVFIGAFASSKLSGNRTTDPIPALWRARFGDSVAKLFVVAFFGGALMMFSARLAKGCTSGHGISGSLQLALSRWVFVGVLFVAAIATAYLLYGKKGASHV